MSNAPGDRDAFDERLKELEREVRRLAARLTALETGAASQSGGVLDELRVKRLCVVDDEGVVRIRARTDQDGLAGVWFFDREGKFRIIAGTNADNVAAVTLKDQFENARIVAMTDSEGLANVWWLDRQGKTRISAATRKDGTVELPTKDWKERP